MFHVAGGDGRFLPCDLICSSFGYDKPGIWTKGLFTGSPSQRSQNWGCPSRCLLWVLSCTLQSAPLFNMLGLGLLFLFFLIFLMCIFRSAFKQGTEVPNLRNQGKQEGACCANILGNVRASHRNFNSDRRGERGERRFRLFLSQSCTWLTWKSPSPKDY